MFFVIFWDYLEAVSRCVAVVVFELAGIKHQPLLLEGDGCGVTFVVGLSIPILANEGTLIEKPAIHDGNTLFGIFVMFEFDFDNPIGMIFKESDPLDLTDLGHFVSNFLFNLFALCWVIHLFGSEHVLNDHNLEAVSFLVYVFVPSELLGLHLFCEDFL